MDSEDGDDHSSLVISTSDEDSIKARIESKLINVNGKADSINFDNIRPEDGRDWALGYDKGWYKLKHHPGKSDMRYFTANVNDPTSRFYIRHLPRMNAVYLEKKGVNIHGGAKYLPTLLMAFTDAAEEAPSPCTKCAPPKGMPRFHGCLIATEEDGTPVWDGACLHCYAQGSSSRCSLSQKEESYDPEASYEPDSYKDGSGLIEDPLGKMKDKAIITAWKNQYDEDGHLPTCDTADPALTILLPTLDIDDGRFDVAEKGPVRIGHLVMPFHYQREFKPRHIYEQLLKETNIQILRNFSNRLREAQLLECRDASEYVEMGEFLLEKRREKQKERKKRKREAEGRSKKAKKMKEADKSDDVASHHSEDENGDHSENENENEDGAESASEKENEEE